MKLYDFAFSPNCRKVRAVAYELGTPLDYVSVDLVRGESRLPGFLAKNPNGRVPVLEDGDLLLWESNAIIAYLGAGSLLVPADRRERAEVDRWLAWQLAHLGPATRVVAFERIVKKLVGGGVPDEAAIASATEDFDKLSTVLDRWLEKNEYVAGRLSIADFALASHYSIAASCGLDVASHPRVDSWLGRMLGRESMKRALADAQKALS
jgi:glutathione S-transferase